MWLWGTDFSLRLTTWRFSQVVSCIIAFCCWVGFHGTYVSQLNNSPLKNIWDISSPVGWLPIKLLWTFTYPFLCEPKLSFPWSKCLRVLFAGSYGNCMLRVIRNHHTVSRVAVPLYIPCSNVWMIHFLHILKQHLALLLSYFSHSDRCVVINYCGFNLLFSDG